MAKAAWKYLLLLTAMSCYIQSGNGREADPELAERDPELIQEKKGGENVESGTKSHLINDEPNMLGNKMKLSTSQADESQGKDSRYESQHDNSQFMHGSQHNSHIFQAGAADQHGSEFNDDEIQEDSRVVFEESGDKDELLVDQMKRLSEKVKQAQSKSVDHGVKSEPAERSQQQSKQEQKYQIDPVSDGNRKQDVVSEKVKDNKVTVLDQFKEIEEKVHKGEIFVHEVETEDKEGAFPEENIDTNGKSVDKIVEKSSTSQIHNTKPPVSDIHPSRTSVFEKVPSISADELSADKTVVKETSIFNNLKPSSIDTFTDKTSIPYSKTFTDTEDSATRTVNSNIAKKNNRIKRYKQSLEGIQSSQTLQGSTQDLNIASTLKIYEVDHASSLQKSVDIKATRTDTQASQDLNLKEANVHGMEIKPHDEDIRYSGTVHDGAFQSVSIDQSSVRPSGEMHKTQVNQHTSVKHNTDIINMAEKEQNIPKSAESPLTYKDADQPPIQETASHEQSQQHQPPPPPEESQEDKEKKEQAQKYFEEGEKLVNTSYKKDYMQAYEYFKLAADMGHTRALEYLGFGFLLGDYIKLDPEKALYIFKDLSAKGLPRGQLGLGLSYSAGLAVNSSQAKALIYFTFSALGGDPLAQMVLGYRYLSGIGVESKCETALQYYRKVATTVAENTSSGSPVIQRIRLNEHADNKENGATLMDADLLQYYEFLADKGDVQAQVVLGQLYYQGGRGVPLNHERAHHYFSMAAESGNSNSLAFLGKMHSEGSPVIAQDHNLAHRYFKRAADKGNPIGQCGLGTSYLYGNGIEKDYGKALRYFTQSADQGWSDGQLHLGIMHFSGKGVRRDYKLAVKYFNLASQGGHVLAFYHLAQMHATGTGVLRNCHTAVELYKNVAERGLWASKLMEAHQLYKEGNVNEALLKYTFLAELGYEVAQTNVAYILDQGESSLFDQKETYQRALLHWTRAASQGSTMARLKMGDYHYYGYGTEIDYETAATHYRLATEQQHNAQAMFNLGYMHENGLGLKQDVHLAKRFYDMAAETSVDAYVPVSLALVKLGMFYGVDVFNKELEGYYTFLNRLDPRYVLGPNWDIYLATFLAIVLGIVIILRRQR